MTDPQELAENDCAHCGQPGAVNYICCTCNAMVHKRCPHHYSTADAPRLANAWCLSHKSAGVRVLAEAYREVTKERDALRAALADALAFIDDNAPTTRATRLVVDGWRAVLGEEGK